MTNALTAFGNGAGLPSRDEVAQFINSAAIAIQPGNSGKQFLKISDKDGVWTYGAEETVVEDDALWAINPLSFFHGYIAWHDGKPEQEHRQSVSRPHLPDPATLPPVKAQNGYQVQYGFELVCISGEDEGVVCEYKASSTGGKRGTGEVVNAINSRAGVDPDSIVPIVKLRNNKYWDKKYKKDQFPPVFEVVEWRSLNDASPVGESDRQEEEVKEPARRRAAPAATTAPEPTDEDEALAAEYAAEKEAQAPSAEASPRRRVRR
jgi:hypothetical protein